MVTSFTAGLAGNVSSGAAAMAALNLVESQTLISYSDFHPLVHNYISSSSGNSCLKLKPTINYNMSNQW
jgi:hypothetical protein